MNEWYARDTSKKIKSTFKAKGKSGKHVASTTPYGYLKDPENRDQWNDSLPGIQKERKKWLWKKWNTKTEGNTFTKKIGQTVYVVRYHFNEDAKETMQEKINRMLVTEVSRQAVY